MRSRSISWRRAWALGGRDALRSQGPPGYDCRRADAASPRGPKWPGRSRGRLSAAGLLCYRPGLPAPLCYQLRRHTSRKRRTLDESDYTRLFNGAHHLLIAPLIVVWDRLSTHISKRMKALVTEREWLTAVLLPSYAPELNPVEGLWTHIKHRLAKLATHTPSELETLLRRRLMALQYRHSLLSSSPTERPSPSTDRTDPKTPKPVTVSTANLST